MVNSQAPVISQAPAINPPVTPQEGNVEPQVQDQGIPLQSPKDKDTINDEAFRQWIELEVLKIMKQQVSNKNVSQQRIQDMANRTLDLLQPGMSIEQLFQHAIKLNDGYPEFDAVTVQLIKEYEHKYKKKAVDQVSTLVKTGELDQAQDIMKKVLAFKMM